MSHVRLNDRERAILAVIRCGLDQGMAASYFGDDWEVRTVRRMARRGIVRIVGKDGIWTLATLGDAS